MTAIDSDKTGSLLADGHLSDQGVLLYTEAMRLDRLADLPEPILAHVGDCAYCRQRVFEYYEFVKDEPVARPHPFFDRQARQVFLGQALDYTPYKRLAVAAAVVMAVAAALVWYIATNPGSPSPNPLPIAGGDSTQVTPGPAQPTSQQEEPPAPQLTEVPEKEETPPPQQNTPEQKRLGNS